MCNFLILAPEGGDDDDDQTVIIIVIVVVVVIVIILWIIATILCYMKMVTDIRGKLFRYIATYIVLATMQLATVTNYIYGTHSSPLC